MRTRVFGWTAALGLIGALLLTPSPVAAASVGISLSCYSNPERTTIHNSSSHKITIYSVGSTYHPYSFEPFHVNKGLKAGHSITYQTGPAASNNVLTHSYIYNDNGLDGARVKASTGTYTRHC